MHGGSSGKDGMGTGCQQVALSAGTVLSLHLGVLLWEWDLGESHLCFPSLGPVCNHVVGADVTPPA